MTANREYHIDNLRAVAILLVVFGHSVILYSDGWALYSTMRTSDIFNYAKKYIDIIQMPIFFAVSGYLFNRTCKRREDFSWGGVITERACRLLVPYFAFSLLWMVPIRLAIQYPGYKGKSISYILLDAIILGSDNGHLWYLIALFGCTMVYFFLNRRVSISERNSFTQICLIMVSALCAILCGVIPTKYGGIHLQNTARYFVWFLLGGVIQSKKDLLMTFSRNKKTGYIICLALVAIICSYLSIHAFALASYISAGAVVILALVFFPKKKCKFLSRISSSSFGVYLFHSPLIYITFTYFSEAPPLIVFVINYFVWGVCSYLLTYMLKKSKLKVLLGE